MSRVHAYETDGTRHLIRIECDACDATIKPHPEIAKSGWVKCGFNDEKQGGRFDYDYCPDHADRAIPYQIAMENEIKLLNRRLELLTG